MVVEKINKKGYQMKTNKLTEVQTMIMTMDSDEMNEVIEMIKFRRNQIQSEAKKMFKVGDKVYFVSKRQGKIYGTVEKINRKYIIIDQTNGMMSWRVSPSFLNMDNK
tara:strand:- start:1891 stop:2211 length:321 start_codon:yes stop_codon:yes gene_type:complete